jgi:rare lipoprotein A
VFHTILTSIVFSLCIIGCTKSTFAFDISNSTLGTEQQDFTQEKRVERPLSIPPQPRNKNGNFVCTRNRYVQDERQSGMVSWYGNEFNGRRTASGERFNQNANTLAHLTLPMGTEVLVENPETGIILHARVNDCGPFVKGRIADLSRSLAEKLGIMARGKGAVIITVL